MADPITPEEQTQIGGGADPTKPPPSIIGQQVVLSDGTLGTVRQGFAQDTTGINMGNSPGVPLGQLVIGTDNGAIPFPGGLMVTPNGMLLNTTANGEIASSRQGTSDNVVNYLTTGNPFVSLSDLGQGSSGTVVGSRAGDPGGAITAMMNYYQYQIAEAGMPRQQAIEEFNRKAQIIGAIQDNEVSQGTFDQNAAHYTNVDTANYDANRTDITKAQQLDERTRQEDAIARAQNIQEERGRRATSLAQNILPTSIAGATSMQLPFIGKMPLAQIQPDKFYDIPGLNAIPQMPQSSQYNFAPATAPVAIPNPTLSPVTAGSFGPELPTPAPVQLPDISGLLGQLISGSPGYRV